MRWMHFVLTAAKVIQMNTKSYSELITIRGFLQRYEYLKLSGRVGVETFGSKRWVNQKLYRLPEWLRFRDKIIIRDCGCDLGVDGYDVFGPIIIHHINPITLDDILKRAPCVFDPENVICTKLSTHNAIHYGDESLLITEPIIRSENDTCPWLKLKSKG